MKKYLVKFSWGKKIIVDAASKAEAILKMRRLVDHNDVEARNRMMQDAYDQIEKGVREVRRHPVFQILF